MRSLYLLAITFLISITNLKAQQPTAAPVTGTVKGIIRDTVHNYVLKSATVSIYKADNTVINYQLSNNYGEFKFGNLPLEQALRLDISNVGYKTVSKNIKLSKTTPLLDLKVIAIAPQDVNLKEVTITIPPITYNNDTLEINAGAFKLDTNATVEDLLKKVPNITVWGDGLITVNGKEVKSLLVNGKDFFGGDSKIALQNIPKNALEKIQIFNTADKNKPLDSNLVANLKLKKGKDRSYFGKIGFGYGTDNHYQFDGNLNFSTPKLQLSVIGASNDVNKIPNDINTLIRNSTYKGVGTSVEYQPDFRQSGLNKGNVAGAQMIYNFKPDSKQWNNKSSLTADYYFRNLDAINEGTSQTTTLIANNNSIVSNSENNSASTSNRHRFNSIYTLNQKSHSLTISESLNLEQGNNNSVSTSDARNENGQLTSTNNRNSTGNNTNNTFNFATRYNYSNYNNWNARLKSFGLDYSLAIIDNDNDRTDITAFRDFANPTKNLDINRRYQNAGKNVYQDINFKLPGVQNIAFKNKNLGNLNLELGLNVNLDNKTTNNIVEDLVNNNYEQNTYLTNNYKTNQVKFQPNFSLNKTFYKNLTNRYYKNLTFNISGKQQIINQDNKSIKSFQNIKRDYNNFLPTIGVSASNQQTGSYSQNISLNYSVNVNIPSLEQLAPLIDNSNQHYLQHLNLNLHEEKSKSLSFMFQHNDTKSKNTLSFNVNANLSQTNGAIIDSTYIDAQNRRNVYLTNVDGAKSANISGSIRKAFKLKTSEIQLNFNTRTNFNKRPNYTNGVFNFSNNVNNSQSISAVYSYKDKLGLEASQAVQTSNSEQKSLNSKYSNTTNTSALSANYNFTKKLSLSSNINFNNNNPSVGETVNFTIWNANATYRFTKGNNAEVKFSALDILRQNKSIFNYAQTNSFTTSTRNVLQQYFMVTLSYYPRKFGTTDKPKK